jgi:hypothetical protein
MTASITPSGPHDTPLTEVLADYDRRGYTGQFAPLEGGDLRCLTCRETFAASHVQADEVRRLEGASDPADMSVVVPLACPHCGTRGTFVAHYGPDAGIEEADVLSALDRAPSEDTTGPDLKG